MEQTSEEYRQQWNSRLRAAFLDYIVLFLGGFSVDPVYPYSIYKVTVELWGEGLSPPLQTVYSTINRLEHNGLININQEISGGRVQKRITTSNSGFEMMEAMKLDIGDVNHTLSHLEEKYYGK